MVRLQLSSSRAWKAAQRPYFYEGDLIEGEYPSSSMSRHLTSQSLDRYVRGQPREAGTDSRHRGRGTVHVFCCVLSLSPTLVARWDRSRVCSPAVSWRHTAS
jgi:hypothetical protein